MIFRSLRVLITVSFASLAASACQTPDATQSPAPSTVLVSREGVAGAADNRAARPTLTQSTEMPSSGDQPSQPVEGMADDPDCTPFSDKVREPPFFIHEAQVMITRVAHICVTRNQRGYKRGSLWLAMGFPCTGSGGRLSWKGMQANPKAIHFEVTNACPMSPASASELNAWLAKSKVLPADVRVAAIYPFGLQYWQLQDYVDQDIGEVIDFVSQPSMTKAWKGFLADKPVRVMMYGRQNSFVQDGRLFAVEAELVHAGRRSFKVRVKAAEAMSPSRLQTALSRCQELGASRDCAEVFSPEPGQ